MGCIECEVPAVVTRGRGGERRLEKGKKTEGGIWSADYAEHTELLAEKQKPLPITGREERGGEGMRGGR